MVGVVGHLRRVCRNLSSSESTSVSERGERKGSRGSTTPSLFLILVFKSRIPLFEPIPIRSTQNFHYLKIVIPVKKNSTILKYLINHLKNLTALGCFFSSFASVYGRSDPCVYDCETVSYTDFSLELTGK